VILNGARIGRHCLVGAKSLVTEGKDLPRRLADHGQPGQGGAQLDARADRAPAVERPHYVRRRRRTGWR
jgi:carbonic anhydrase/acetyltransferase-like protein (isoleucine patch superfamily)